MKISKVFILLAAFIVLLEFASLGFFVLAPAADAQSLSPAEKMKSDFEKNKNLDVRKQLRVPFPQWEDLGEPTWEPCADSKPGNEKLCMRIPWIAKYIGNLYKYGIVIGSILAVMMIMIGGVIYMTGGANPSMITRGKEYIVGAVTGIILLLGSYILLNTINPDLINLKTIDVEVVKKSLIVPDDCDYIIADKDPDLKGKLTVPNYPSGKTCGDKFDVKVNDQFRSEFKVDDKTQCTGMRCDEVNKGCTNQLSGKYDCVPAYVLGSIRFKCKGAACLSDVTGSNPAQDTNLIIGQSGNTGFVKSVALKEMDSDDEIGSSLFKNRSTSYMITSGSGSATQDGKKYYLEVKVNDIQSIKAGDVYKVNKDGNAEAIQRISGTNKCCIATCTSSGLFTVTEDQNCERLFSKSELNAAKLNLNTEKFYCGDTSLFDSKFKDLINNVQVSFATGTYCFDVVR